MEIKFSIVVPIYNVEKYLDKCLESIATQSYQNFEVILINDGSTDNSEKIVQRFIKHNSKFKYFSQENKGLSGARNFGAEKTTGDYLLFVDSDDYLSPLLLEKIYQKIKINLADVYRISLQTVNEKYKSIKTYSVEYDGDKKTDMLKSIIKSGFLEPAPLYIYKSSFYFNNNFSFPENKFHEDYALIPEILVGADKIVNIKYVGYNYLLRNNSITTKTNYEHIKNCTNDFQKHFENHIKKIRPNSLFNKIMLEYLANSAIIKGNELNDIDYNNYIVWLKSINISKYIYAYNLKKLIKKIYIKLFLRSYMKKKKNN